MVKAAREQEAFAAKEASAIRENIEEMENRLSPEGGEIIKR